MSATAARAAACVRTTDHSSLGVDDVDRWCGTAASSAGARLGGADVHPPVDLHRVERHDLDVAERPRDRERELRLARRGGADDREVQGQPARTGMRTRAGLAPQPVRRRAGDAHRMPGAGRGVGGEVHQLVLPGAAREHGRVLLRRSVDEHLLDAADPRLVVLERVPLDERP